jgi:outer membrane protein OmpA-like peptidoglycan-associated protein
MNKIYILVTALLTMLTLTACNGRQNVGSSTTDNSRVNSTNDKNIPQPSIPQPNIPQPNIPQINIPQTNIPQTNIPQTNIPQTNIPQVKFPEVTFSDVKIQQNQNSTIYTLPADILFDFDKADLQADAEVALQQISSSIAQRFANAPIQINGHTDSVGNNAYNRELSKRRAESVRQWLITKTNIQPDQMTIQGRGKSQPVAPNTKPDGSDNPQGRQQNRRVEIIVRASSS